MYNERIGGIYEKTGKNILFLIIVIYAIFITFMFTAKLSDKKKNSELDSHTFLSYAPFYGTVVEYRDGGNTIVLNRENSKDVISFSIIDKTQFVDETIKDAILNKKTNIDICIYSYVETIDNVSDKLISVVIESR